MIAHRVGHCADRRRNRRDERTHFANMVRSEDAWVNGRWYYLNADGDMAIGWILVNGVWYYLNPMAGVLDPGGNPIPEGAMYVSAVTPDGYHVGVSGALIGR